MISIFPSASSSTLISSLVISIPYICINNYGKSILNYLTVQKLNLAKILNYTLFLLLPIFAWFMTQIGRLSSDDMSEANIVSDLLYKKFYSYFASPFIGLSKFLNDYSFTSNINKSDIPVYTFGRLSALIWGKAPDGAGQIEYNANVFDINISSNLYSVYQFLIQDIEIFGTLLLIFIFGFLLKLLENYIFLRISLSSVVLLTPLFVYYPVSIYYQSSVFASSIILLIMINIRKIRLNI